MTTSDSRSGSSAGGSTTPENAVGDPYRELEVDPRADAGRIRKAYHAKARLLHPDRGGDPAAMARLNVAYELLRDPVRRRQHDARQPGARPRRNGPPPWTGAAGRPPGKPAGPVLDFGIFAGWSIGEVARHDPGYLDWLAERPDGRPYLAAIEQFLAPVRDAAAARSGSAGGRSAKPEPHLGRSRWRG
jgi:curved DNA-binding protein CbpA